MPGLNKEFIAESKLRDELHCMARNSNNEKGWHLIRNQHNKVNKLNKSNKDKYFNHILNIKDNDRIDDEKFSYKYNDRIMWKTTKKITQNNKQTPPRVITHNGNVITSLKSIFNISINHYTEKILK